MPTHWPSGPQIGAAGQPDRLQLGQRGADGGGADRALGQVHAHARDAGGLRVVAVHRAVDVDHQAARVGEDGEVAGVRHGARERLDHRRGGAQQRLVGLDCVAHGAGRHGVERDVVARLEAEFEAAAPRALDPGRQQGRGLGRAGVEHRLARLFDQGQPLLVGHRRGRGGQRVRGHGQQKNGLGQGPGW
jgi:hypothetical protein